jgi:hypothetical protein
LTRRSVDRIDLTQTEQAHARYAAEGSLVMSPRTTLAVLLCLPIAVVSVPALAGSWGIEFDNDRIVATDRHFTHGTRLFWAGDADETPRWAQRFGEWMPGLGGDGALYLGAALGQNMFTPDDITTKTLVANDRPYAGWLYGSLGLTRQTARNRRSWGIDLGIVGPASLAEPTQKFVHEVVGATTPRGWDNQLGNEPGLVLSYEESWQQVNRIDDIGLEAAIAPHIAASFGNVYTYAAAGASVRVGDFAEDDWGPARIRPAIPGTDRIAAADGFAWYASAGIEGRLFGRNIFLDGNSFTDSHSVDKNAYVVDIQLGFTVAIPSARLSLMQVFRTPEFEGQPGADSFGVVQLAFRL